MTRGLAHLGGALALAVVAAAAPAAAQLANLPAEVRAEIAAMGPNLTPEIVKNSFALMRPLQAPEADLKATTDIAYGSDPLQTLDVWEPKGGKRRAPVVVYVHGGGFTGGDKKDYSNIPAYFARHGMLGVNVNYRLAPKISWPAASEDVGSAIAWVEKNAAAHGGDPKRIVVIGHSAGAAAVASYVLDRSLAPKGGTGVVGAVLISGPYRLDPPRGPTDHIYYGDDASTYAARAPFGHVTESKLPVLLVMSEFDPALLATDTLALAAEICGRDKKCPDFLWLAGHNHISETSSIDTRDNRLGAGILAFVGTVAK